MDQRTSAIDEDLKNIVHTRVAIAEKLDLLEKRIKVTAEEAIMPFSHMLDKTTARVNHMVDKTKSTLDPVQKVDEHPWLMLGAAVCAGYAIGLFESRARAPRNGVYPYYPSGAHASNVMPGSGRPAEPSDKTKGVYDYYPTGYPAESQSQARRASQQWTNFWDSMSPEFKGEAEQAKQALLQAGRTLMSEVARKVVPDTVRSFAVKLSDLLPPDERASRSQAFRASKPETENHAGSSTEHPAAAP
ncbi:MAG: hypothetical protein K0S45_2788 [Nitrospira sp.]|jgi:hypothetical protein|nr:hypothetical protein [Nitrospira sp.]